MQESADIDGYACKAMREFASQHDLFRRDYQLVLGNVELHAAQKEQ